MSESLIKFLPRVTGQYRENVIMSNTTWFKVGGPAEVIFKPENTEDLSNFIPSLDKNIPLNILGLCSNVIVRDKGIHGVTIRLGAGFTGINIDENIVTIGCASTDYNTAMFLYDHGLSGLEFLVGIPGSLGGAIAMNAGCYGSETAEYLLSVEAIHKTTGKIYNLTVKDLEMSYRHSPLKEEFIFTKASFALKNMTNKDKIKEKMDEITNSRTLSQPIKERTGGSTFKNPGGKKAWELIEESRLRGHVLGGAKVSEKHCNFLINTGTATAADIENLGNFIQKTVYNKTNIMLEWEIVRIGL